MKDNQKLKWDDVTLESLEAKLRSIPKPDVPVTLKEKLLAAIPKKKIKTFSPVRPGFGFWSYGATAAVITILIAAAFFNFNVPDTSHKTVVDMNEGLSNNFPNDLNVPLIEDINYVNDNIQLRNIETKSALSLW
jgi:hypothetical protein